MASEAAVVILAVEKAGCRLSEGLELAGVAVDPKIMSYRRWSLLSSSLADSLFLGGNGIGCIYW